MMSTLIGFSASFLIGVSLGLIGGGGSILTLPVLVYLLHLDPVRSTVYSLFIVGTTSLVGSLTYLKRRLVDYPAVIAFALPSFLTVLVARRLILPHLPDHIALGPDRVLTQSVALMLLFALIMVAAALALLRDPAKSPATPLAPATPGYGRIALQGGLVGLLTGLVGAGGGFLIIPALVLLARLPVKTAVGTSLSIIAANSFVGFLGSLPQISVDWPFLLPFTALSVAGIFAGTYLTRFVSGSQLRKAFGWVVLLLGSSILVKEIFLN